jgi:capsular polysaccharide export protein
LDEGDIIWEKLTPQVYTATAMDLVVFPSWSETESIGNYLFFSTSDHGDAGIQFIPSITPSDFDTALKLLSIWGTWRYGTLLRWCMQGILPKDTLVKLINNIFSAHSSNAKEFQNYFYSKIFKREIIVASNALSRPNQGKGKEKNESIVERLTSLSEICMSNEAKIKNISTSVNFLRDATITLFLDLIYEKRKNEPLLLEDVLDRVPTPKVFGTSIPNYIKEKDCYFPLLFQASEMHGVDEGIAALTSSEIVYLFGFNDNWRILPSLSAIHEKPVFFVEDGFLKAILTYVDKGETRYHSGVCFYVDDLGFHFDGSRPTRLELNLNSDNYMLSQEQIERTKRLMNTLVSEKLTKYNHQPIFNPNVGRTGHRKVLVIDQSYNDFSVIRSGANADTFKKMLADAQEENPDADVIVKIHPDTLIRKKTAYFSDVKEKEGLYLFSQNINPFSLLELVDKVYVCSSQLGFEALMAGKEVHVYGMPFYAGWGATIDAKINLRRNKKRSIEELFYAAYILSSRYVDPVTGKWCEIERAIEYLLKLRKEYYLEYGT